jgi:tetratricopeptide (TPR) repeat protein
MKHILTLICVCFAFAHIGEAQIRLRGVVSVQNSKTNKGKTEYVPGAEAKVPSLAPPTPSNEQGLFVLQITGTQYGNKIQVLVDPSKSRDNKYKNYVVVNEEDLKKLVLGVNDTIDVYITDATELEAQKARLVGINMDNYIGKKQYNQMRERLQKEMFTANSRSNRYKEIIDSLNFIRKDEDNMQKMVEEFVEQLVRINLDNIKESDAIGVSRKKAYECSLRGELDSVLFYLQDREALLHEAIQKRDDAQKMQEAARQMETTAQITEQQQTKNINELITDLILMARTAKLQNNHAEAEKNYQIAVDADSLNYENVLEFADYLRRIREYDKADVYYQSCLNNYEQLAATSQVYLPDLAKILTAMGNNYRSQKKFEKA